MFLQLSVSHSVHGGGACMAGDMHGGGHAWQGVCMAWYVAGGGMCGEGGGCNCRGVCMCMAGVCGGHV